MNLRLREEYIGCKISQPNTGKIISLDQTEYEYYYNNGYQHLFVDVPVKETPTEPNDIPNTESE